MKNFILGVLVTVTIGFILHTSEIFLPEVQDAPGCDMAADFIRESVSTFASTCIKGGKLNENFRTN